MTASLAAPAPARTEQPVEPPAGAADGSSTRESKAPLLIVALLVLVFFVNASGWIAAPFGESHDGRNAAVWGLASKALRHDPIGSRLGGRPPADADVYAHHPPLIIAETALAETIGGEHRLTTRSPAWIGSVVGLVLLALLLLDAGLAPTAVAVGIVVAFGSGMFLTYGTMLDTPVTSLPFTLALLVGWQRARQRRPWPSWALAAVAALAVLSGWEALVITGIAGLVLVVDAWRGRVDRRSAVALAIGASVGLALTLAWVAWVYGSLGPLLDRTDGRASGVDIVTAAGQSLTFARDLFPYALPIGVLAALVSWRDPRARALLLVTASSVLLYSAAFHTAAWIHDYWNYLFLIPLAIAIARGVQRLLDARTSADPRLLRVALCVLACLPLALSAARPSLAQQLVVNGIPAGHLAQVAGRLHHGPGPAMGYITSVDTRVDSLGYESGWAAKEIRGRGALRKVAAEDPSFPVITTLVNPKRAPYLRRHAIAVDGFYALVRAEDCYRAGCGS